MNKRIKRLKNNIMEIKPEICPEKSISNLSGVFYRMA
jgi:hypothetical protein